jgi:NADP-dependent alcohol dehydrogenase
MSIANFSFHNPTRILFGEGQIGALSGVLPPTGKILMLYGAGSIRHNGVYDQVIKALNGREWVEFSGVEPNPEFDTLMRAVQVVKQQGIDFILAVGGGSVVDGAKFIAAACYYPSDPWDILSQHVQIDRALPFGCVLTLPATGSESNGNSVVTRGSLKEKRYFGSPLVYPVFAVLDPLATYSLPPRQVANGVVDAFVHIIEQYLTYPVDAKVQDRFAEGLLLTLIEEGPQALAHPQNYSVRANLMWAATQALNGLIGVGVPQDWSTHMIGHEITALFGLDHAQTLAIILPAVMRQQQDKKAQKLRQFGMRVWGLADDAAILENTVAATEQFFIRLGVATRLSDYGIGEEAIEPLVAALEKKGFVALGEQADITPPVVRDILRKALPKYPL